MSRYVAPAQSFLNYQFVYLVDLATGSPVATFLTDRGAIVQSRPDKRTRFVLLHCGQAEASAHLLDEAAVALNASSPAVQLLDYQDVRRRLLRPTRRSIVDALVGEISGVPSLGVQI